MLSFALIYGSTRDDPTEYKNQLDNLRAVCEIFSIGFLMLHLFDEIGEMARFVRNNSQYEAAVRKLKSFLFNKYIANDPTSNF